uniref:Uncharacterized protein n=1 Tax=Anguilla anguilla TaxID=7936 RepID=A0A0E9R2A5_ANGAN
MGCLRRMGYLRRDGTLLSNQLMAVYN